MSYFHSAVMEIDQADLQQIWGKTAALQTGDIENGEVLLRQSLQMCQWSGSRSRSFAGVTNKSQSCTCI